jgi:hypothetical protein
MEKPKCQKTAERAKKYREMHKARRRKLEAFVAYILKFQGIEVLQNFEVYVVDNGDDPYLWPDQVEVVDAILDFDTSLLK